MEGYTLGHVSKDESSRASKATKIVKILQAHTDLAGKNVLDIGTGSGFIANSLSKLAAKVDSIDIVDDRIIKDGYTQTLVTDETLPFPDSSFDVAITNQVLEHVPDHLMHLSEIRRVLTDGGVVYLASPNKWWLTDPHYKLPFISWLPRGIAGWYLKVTKGRKWDIYSASLRELESLADRAGFDVTDEFWTVLTDPGKYEMKIPGPVVTVAKRIPGPVRRLLLNVVPTHVKVLRARG